MTCKWKYATPAPLDDLWLFGDGGFLSGLCFEGHGEETHAGSDKRPMDIPKRLSPVLSETCRWLDRYFAGRPPASPPPFHLHGLTPFRSAVMEALLEIPWGCTTTYGAIARTIARKRGIPVMSAQAVGGAVGWNPVCIIIPCHRVVGASGSLTGYGGGLSNKAALLALEGASLP